MFTNFTLYSNEFLTFLILLKLNKMFCALLGGTTFLLTDPVSRDISNWLFRLFWTLFPEMCPTGYFFSSRLCFPEMFPTGYCFSSGDICDLAGRSIGFLCSFGRHHSLAYRPCLQRCFQLVITSLLDSIFQRCSQQVIASLLEIIVILLEDQ